MALRADEDVISCSEVRSKYPLIPQMSEYKGNP